MDRHHELLQRIMGKVQSRLWDRLKTFVGCPWSSGPQMGPGILPETTVNKHSPPCHLQMPTKALSCKKEATCEHGPEAPSCPEDQGSIKMDCFKAEKCSMVRRVKNLTFLLEITNAVFSRLKRWENFQCVINVQFTKPAYLLVWGCISAYCMGSLHVLEGTRNDERYIQVLEQHMLPSRQCLFQGRPCVFEQDNAKPHTAVITTAWLRSRGFRVLNWPACSPDISPIENMVHWCIIKRKYVKDDHKLFSSWKVTSGKNGTQISNTKTPETHNLDAKTLYCE